MSKYAIVGVGKVGYAIAKYLLDYSSPDKILLSDKNNYYPDRIRNDYPDRDLVCRSLDLSEPLSSKHVLEEYDAVISGLPYYLNLPLARIALEAGCHYVDLGGNDSVTEKVFELNGEATQRNVSVIPDCGLAPGLVSMIAADAIEQCGEVDDISLRVGGLPQNPAPPFNYQVTFSVSGLINEYKEPVKILSEGEEKIVDSLGGLETIEFKPFGELEAFYTSGGMSTLARTLCSKAKNISYKTIRFPGHQIILESLRQIGFFEDEQTIIIDDKEFTPRACLEALIGQRYSSDASDMILVYCTASGGNEIKMIYRLHDTGDNERGLTAMQKCTALPAAIISKMQVEGLIKSMGVQPQELVVPVQQFFSLLREWDLKMEIAAF